MVEEPEHPFKKLNALSLGMTMAAGMFMFSLIGYRERSIDSYPPYGLKSSSY